MNCPSPFTAHKGCLPLPSRHAATDHLIPNTIQLLERRMRAAQQLEVEAQQDVLEGLQLLHRRWVRACMRRMHRTGGATLLPT